MYFTSTRAVKRISAAQAIAQGISEDGGLFVPSEFPALDCRTLNSLVNMSYKERAKKVLALYLNDYTETEIDNCVENAYSGNFDNDIPAPLTSLSDNMHILELWHGPTCAFKDMALQILPHLLTTAAAKVAPDEEKVILVATSGDTGKAALEGFADVPKTKIIVFYPVDGVSNMQKLQMTTQKGANVAVCAIEGNFDDAQTGVKNIFGDADMQKYLTDRKMAFSSANSINFGRLVPQIIYYVSAYCDLVKDGKIAMGDKINVVVPTGNFGNILAAVYARNMGIPIARFICASNRNKILTDFIATGVYDRNREFYQTDSPSMDILISSNLERMLYHLYDNNPAAIAALMQDLKEKGRYQVSAEVLEKLQKEFFGGFCDDNNTAETIKKLFDEYHYLCDTHTAVAVNVYEQYLKSCNDSTPCVIASTASPYKFASAVLAALDGSEVDDEFAMLDNLSEISGTAVPAPLAGLSDKEVLHKKCVNKTQMAEYIRDFLK